MIKKLHAQFANDTWAGIKFDQESFNELMKTFREFSEYSGLKINFAKTEILRLGQLRLQEEINWSKIITESKQEIETIGK